MGFFKLQLIYIEFHWKFGSVRVVALAISTLAEEILLVVDRISNAYHAEIN